MATADVFLRLEMLSSWYGGTRIVGAPQGLLSGEGLVLMLPLEDVVSLEGDPERRDGALITGGGVCGVLVLTERRLTLVGGLGEPVLKATRAFRLS